MSTAPPTTSFVDVRRFARALPPPGSPSGLDRQWLAPPPGPGSVGVLRVPPGAHDERAVADEFVLCHEGAVTLQLDGAATALVAGQSAVVRSGTQLQWQAASDAVLIVMRHGSTDGGEHGVVSIDADPQLLPSAAPSPDLLTTPAPTCRNRTDFRSRDGEFTCGTWDATPYARRAMRYRHDELMHLLEGTVTIVDGTGRTATFTRGDTFLVPLGAECSWDSPEYVRKVFAIRRPA